MDALLEIKELNAIQWTPGVGEPQGGDPRWYDLYKRIIAGGKSIMANWVTLDELEPQRIDLVQGLEFALWIPPAFGSGAEFVDFVQMHVV